VESRRPLDRWTSERQIKAEQGSVAKGERRSHLPLALLFAANGKTSTIEVKLERKSRQTLEATSYELESSYISILYFVSAPAQMQVEEVPASSAPSARTYFQLYSLGERGMADEIAPLSHPLVNISCIPGQKPLATPLGNPCFTLRPRPGYPALLKDLPERRHPCECSSELDRDMISFRSEHGQRWQLHRSFRLEPGLPSRRGMMGAYLYNLSDYTKNHF